MSLAEKKRVQRPRHWTRHLFLEQLEDRRLLSVSAGSGSLAGTAAQSVTSDAMFSTSFEPRRPLGSLVYDATISGNVSAADAIENLLVDLDAGQTLSISLVPEASLQATVTLTDSAGTPIGSAVADTAGQTVVLNAIPISSAGQHNLLVRGVAGTTGTFSGRLVLNALLEEEGRGAAANNTIATAENLADSWIPVAATAGERAAALGSADGSPDVVGPDGFGYEAIVVPFEFQDIRATGVPVLTDVDDEVVQLTEVELPGFAFEFYGESSAALYISSNGLITFGAADDAYENTLLGTFPQPAAIAPLWDDLDTRGGADGVYWQLQGDGADQQLIVQWNSVYYFDSAADPITFQAVLSEADGSIRFNYLDLSGSDATRDEGAGATVGIKAASGGEASDRLLVSLNDATTLGVGSSQSLQIGLGLAGEAPPDFFEFRLTEGDWATLAATGAAAGQLDLQLYDGGGALAAVGTTAESSTKFIADFRAPTTGSYYARVTGGGTDYNLIVTRDAGFEDGENNDVSAAQNLPRSGTVLGFLAGPSAAAAAANAARPAESPAESPSKVVPSSYARQQPNQPAASGSVDDDDSNDGFGRDLPGHLIVRFGDAVTSARVSRLLAKYRGRLVRELPLIDAAVIELSEDHSDVERAALRWADDPLVSYAEPDYQLHMLQTRPNDPSFNQLWGMDNTGQTGGTVDADIDAPEAWDTFTGSSSVVVASIDTGVDYTHEDLAANMWVNPGEVAGDGIDNDGNGFIDDIYGIDTANDDSDPLDDQGHGTHTVGTIGAVGNNGIGIAGVNWNVQVMALKFLSNTGSGLTSDAIDAISYMTMMKTTFGVNIVASNNSWGGSGQSQALEDAIQASIEAGIMFVAAAGNSSNNNDVNPEFPASLDLDGVISVAATDHNDQLASFSSFGANTVDVGAPGVDILSTLPGNSYGELSGTSMATPHVTGAVALLMAHSPAASLEQIKTAILTGADRVGSLTGRTVTGGRLNVANSLLLIGDRGDFYRIPVNADDRLLLVTSTPGDGPFEFANDLDPAIELYAPNGTLVASDDNGSSDGRNARLDYLASVTGTYTARVRSAGGRGEYVLQATGQTGSRAGFVVQSSSPSDGQRLAESPSTLQLDFSDAVLLSSLAPSDLTVDGVPALGWRTTDGDSVAFALPALSDGVHTVDVAAGAVQSVSGAASEQFSSQFTVDSRAPRVVSSSLDSVVAAGDVKIMVEFDEAIRGDAIDLSALELTGAIHGAREPANVHYDDSTLVLTVDYVGLEDDSYLFKLFSRDGGIEDLAGNDLDGEGTVPSGDGHPGGDYLVPFSVDASVLSASPFQRLDPPGALLFASPENRGWIHSADDVDRFPVFVPGGQTLLGEVRPDETLAALTIELADGSGRVVAGPVTAAAGQAAALPVTGAASDGIYEVRVSADQPTSYNLDLHLNAAVESAVDGVGAGTPLPIDGSLTSEGRFAVVGTSLPDPVSLDAIVWGVQPASGQIVSVDPLTGDELHRFAAPDSLSPDHKQIGLTIAEGGASLLYLNADVDPNRLYRLDPITGAVQSVESTAGFSASGLGFSSTPPTATTIYAANMDSDPGWTLEGDWQYGTPLGGGSGAGDPTAGFTGTRVIGYNLAGDYTDNLRRTEYAVTPAIDASAHRDVTLSFQRWLGVEGSSFDRASIDVSNDGQNWAPVWSNQTVDITDDGRWRQQTFDISHVADGQATVFVRWGMGPTDSLLTFAGWNIDDVLVRGVPEDTQPSIFLSRGDLGAGRQAGYSGVTANHLTSVTAVGAAGGDDVGRQFAFVPGTGIVEYDSKLRETVLATLPAPAADVEGLAFDGVTLFASSAAGALFSLDPDSGAVVRSVTVSDGGLFGLGAVALKGGQLGIVYSEDFSETAGGFVLDNSAGSGNGLWHRSTGRQRDGLPHHSAPYSIYFGKGEKGFGGGNYETGTATGGVAVSPVISLPAAAPVTLSFNTLIEAESNLFFVEDLGVAVDDGQSQTTLFSTLDSTLPSSTSGVWQPLSADLTSFAGRDIQLRFSMDTLDELDNGFEGWYFDDLAITVGGRESLYVVPEVDTYTLDLTGRVGSKVDIVVAGQGTADFSESLLELVGPQGETVATAASRPLGVQVENYDLGILEYVVPADGIYTLRLTSTTAGDYAVVVTDTVVFDTELVDPPAAPLRRLPAGGSAIGFAGSRDNRARLFAVEEPSNLDDPGTIYELEPLSGAILNSFPTPNVPQTDPYGVNLAFDGDSLWYVAGLPFGDNHIYKLDPDDGTVLENNEFPGAPLFTGLARVGQELFASDGEIHVYDAVDPSHPLLRTLPVPDLLGVGLAGNNSAGTLYSVSQGFFSSGTLYELDAENGQVVRAVPTGSQLNEQGLAIVGDELFVSETVSPNGPNQIAVFDLDTLAPLRRMNIDLPAGGLLAGLGGDGYSGEGPDSYTLTLAVGDQLTVTTRTPLDGVANSPRNELDPMLTLYDAAGAPVAVATDGQPDGKNARLVFQVVAAGEYRLEVSAEGVAGEYVVQAEIQPESAGFQVASLATTFTGFVAQLTNSLDTSELNLYDSAFVGFGQPDVVLRGQATGLVAGSISVGPSPDTVTFVKTEGTLAADTYEVIFRSGPNGFKDTAGNLLDGDADGTAGGDYRSSFTIAAPPADAVTIGLPHVVRGPGQVVNLPANSERGIPVAISDVAGVRRVSLQLHYDPRLLEVVGASVPTGLPPTVQVDLSTETRGVATVTFSTPTELPAGSTTLLHLQARVPSANASVHYLQQQVLDLEIISLVDADGAAMAAIDQDAIHLVTYFGDVSGSGRINASDAAQVARVAGLIDTGFSSSPLIDPLIVGDISGNGRINATDASKLAQFAALLPVAEIPPIPGGLLSTGGAGNRVAGARSNASELAGSRAPAGSSSSDTLQLPPTWRSAGLPARAAPAAIDRAVEELSWDPRWVWSLAEALQDENDVWLRLGRLDKVSKSPL